MDIHHCMQDDVHYVRADIAEFRGDGYTPHLNHDTLTYQFDDTGFLVQQLKRVIVYLLGLVSQRKPAEYFHLIAVGESHKRLGRRLHSRFVNLIRRSGSATPEPITSPANGSSIGFHRALDPEPNGLRNTVGVPVVMHHSGEGDDRLGFGKGLKQQQGN